MSLLFRKTVMPLFLLLSCPPTVMLIWFLNSQLNGSLTALLHVFSIQGFFETLYLAWQPYFWGTTHAWIIIFSFMAFQLLLMRFVPGKIITGPETINGNTPVYKDNGFTCFLITVGTYILFSFGFHLFSPSIIWNHFGGILGALNIFSLCFCLFLYVKGRYFPSSSDSSHTGNFIFDYYWGTELYPRLFGYDIKVFTNCRFGMMSWPLIIISFAAKQAELYGLSTSMLLSVSIMLVYIAKFFWWESGYLRSIDIMLDRAGFYICWGCLVWVPSLYTIPVMYLVHHPIHFNLFIASMIFAGGMASVAFNYMADYQRQRVRATQGECTVWGKKPEVIKALYLDHRGVTKHSLLLTTGYWGISRHFHYLLELSLAFFWTLPALFVNITPWFYWLFLAILLTDRAYRDDKKCAKKYGIYWNQYCEKVPHKIIPWNKIGDKIMSALFSLRKILKITEPALKE